jgi:predicted dienelactone hydrolase
VRQLEPNGTGVPRRHSLDLRGATYDAREVSMNKGFAIVGVSVLAVAVSSVGLLSDRNGELNGHWEGAIAQPSGPLAMTIDFSAGDAGITGAFTLPAVAAFRWPLKITHNAPTLTFRLPTGLLFEGELKGDTITGSVPSPTGGHVDRFSLHRKPATPLPYREEHVTFESGGIVFAGTIRAPSQEGRYPAIFLLQGSGPIDRDGESFYADHFARHGVVTLVYDKRGTGRSGGDYRQESLDDFAADALAGVRYLQGRPDVNAKRIGLYGRSHGGMVVPLAASLSPDVAFIINVSGAGVSPYRQVTYQAEAQMRRDGFSESEIAEAIAYMNQKWAVARSGGEGWSALQMATQAAQDKRWLSRVQPATALKDIVPSWKLQMGYDPMPAFATMTTPFLAIFGALDTFTPVDETIANYHKGLAKAGNRHYTIEVFPGADHFMLVWPKAGDAAHWPVLPAGYLDLMTTWVSNQAAAREGVPRRQ